MRLCWFSAWSTWKLELCGQDLEHIGHRPYIPVSPAFKTIMLGLEHRLLRKNLHLFSCWESLRCLGKVFALKFLYHKLWTCWRLQDHLWIMIRGKERLCTYMLKKINGWEQKEFTSDRQHCHSICLLVCASFVEEDTTGSICLTGECTRLSILGRLKDLLNQRGSCRNSCSHLLGWHSPSEMGWRVTFKCEAAEKAQGRGRSSDAANWWFMVAEALLIFCGCCLKSSGHSQRLANFRGVLSIGVNAAWQTPFILEHIQLYSFDMKGAGERSPWAPSLPARKTKNNRG